MHRCGYPFHGAGHLEAVDANMNHFSVYHHKFVSYATLLCVLHENETERIAVRTNGVFFQRILVVIVPFECEDCSDCCMIPEQ